MSYTLSRLLHAYTPGKHIRDRQRNKIQLAKLSVQKEPCDDDIADNLIVRMDTESLT